MRLGRDEPLLEIENLRVHFRVGSGLGAKRVVKAVDDVSLSLRSGQTLGLVGESGCGKSTLLRALFGLSPIVGGKITVAGRDVTQAGRRERRMLSDHLQMVFQDPYSALDPKLTVHEIVAEPLRVAGRYDRRHVEELLDRVGVSTEMSKRRPSEFSGGQRQRVGIARALALRPRILILDEPVSALDMSIQAQVLNLLDDLQQEFGLAYLLVSHDLSVVRHIADEIAVMYLGRIVERGTAGTVFRSPEHPYTRSLLDSAPSADPDRPRRRPAQLMAGEPPDAENPPSGCAFRSRCGRAQDRCAEQRPDLRESTPGHSRACFFPDIQLRATAS